jgi:uroporphyrinogen decarboxylase
VQPHAAIVDKVRAAGVRAPFIGFPRGAGALVDLYAEGVPVEGVALDTQASAALGRRLQAQGKTIQGALDNLLLRQGGPGLDARIDQLIEQWGQGPYIFNLGHGVLPDTPVENIARAVARITGKPVRAGA